MKLLGVLAMLVLIAGALAFIALLATGPFLWMDVLLLCRVRPRLAVTRIATVVLAIWIPVALVLPLGNGTILGFLAGLFIAPWPTRAWILASAWSQDDPATRLAARTFRNSIDRRTVIERQIEGGRPWPEYLFDVERSKLSERYDSTSGL